MIRHSSIRHRSRRHRSRRQRAHHRRWFTALVGAAACVALASCTSAAVGLASPPPEHEVPLPTEAERAWERTGLPADQRPEIPAIRLVSIFDRPESIAACLREVGYPRAVVVNGAVEPGEVADEQVGSLALSTYICEASYPADPLFDRALTTAQAVALYRYRVSEQRPCLQALGHAIAIPPTEHAFLDSWSERGGWNPMNNVPAFGFDAAVTACPPLPPGFDE